MKKVLLVAAAFTGALGAFSASAQNGQVGKFGSAQQSTYRSCQGATSADFCGALVDNPNDKASGIIQEVYAGGLGQFGSANLELDRPNGDYAFAWSSVDVGNFNLPEIRGATQAGADDRVNINAFGFQSFTWHGQESTAFSIAGNMHIVDSGTQDWIEVQRLGDWARQGGAQADGYVAIWDPAILGDYTSAQDLVANLLFASCDKAGVLGYGRTTVTLRGGESSTSVATTECSAGSLTLDPGQEVLTVSGLRLPTNRGGFVDATHTFTTVFDPALSAETRAGLESNLLAAVVLPGVPEPSTWAMMLIGFGIVGAGMRRRKATVRIQFA